MKKIKSRLVLQHLKIEGPDLIKQIAEKRNNLKKISLVSKKTFNLDN